MDDETPEMEKLTQEMRSAMAAWVADPSNEVLKRLMQREISDKLALALLEGGYQEGATVTVDVQPPLLGQEGLESTGGLVLR